jgi:hypothetical protein
LRPLLQIGAHDADQIIRSFFGRFAVSRHMVANVVFHQFGHEAEVVKAAPPRISQIALKFCF